MTSSLLASLILAQLVEYCTDIAQVTFVVGKVSITCKKSKSLKHHTQLFYPWWARPLYCRVLSPIITLFRLSFVVRKMYGIRTVHFRRFNRHKALVILHVKYTKRKVHKCLIGPQVTRAHFDQGCFSHIVNILVLRSNFATEITLRSET